MAQIKATIELLLRILRENGTTRVSAETFRQAKFDHKDAVTPLWMLLFELLYYCEYGKIDDVSIRSRNSLTTEEVVVYVKCELAQRGFLSNSLRALPRDMSDGSQELLLAFGWLLCKENIIQRFMVQSSTALEDDDTYAIKQTADTNNSTQKSFVPLTDDDINIRMQQILWLNNKLRLNLRKLYALQREQVILKHKIHESTSGVSLTSDREHLSMLETYMIRHPELLKKNLQLLERDNDKIQNLLKWKQHEDVFWKWMESVLDVKVQNNSDLSAALMNPDDVMNADDVMDPEPVDATIPVTSDVYTTVQNSHTQLQDVITKYEAIVNQLEDVWKQKSSEVTNEELDKVLASIELELSLQKANIALNNTETYLQNGIDADVLYANGDHNHAPSTSQCSQASLNNNPCYPHNLVQQWSYRPNSASKTINNLNTNPTAAVGTFTDIEEEIHHLHSVVKQLEGDVKTKQSVFKDEMEMLSSKLQDAVCVPPMGRSVYC